MRNKKSNATYLRKYFHYQYHLKILSTLLLLVCSCTVMANNGNNCATGNSVSGAFAGDLGPAPVSPFTRLLCFEVNNDSDLDRDEMAYASVAISQSENLLGISNLVVVGVNNRVVASQFNIVSRWGSALMNNSAPVRWLQITIPASVNRHSSNVYELRRYQSNPAIVDPFAISMTQIANEIRVNTSVAEFKLNINNPRLFDEILMAYDNSGGELHSVFTDSEQAGPMLVYDNSGQLVQIGGGINSIYDHETIFKDGFDDPTIAGINQGSLSIDSNGFKIIEAGPIKASVQLNGHFIAADGSSLCQTSVNGINISYERYGYSVVAHFYRNKRLIDLDFELRNECSDASTGPWTDEAAAINHLSWSLPMAFVPDSHLVSSNNNLLTDTNVQQSILVQQHKGSGKGSGWQRRASLTLNGQIIDEPKYFTSANLGLSNSDLIVSLQMPYMKYREPQAIAVRNHQLSSLFISEPIILGEGKGIWNQLRFHFTPMDLITEAAEVVLETQKGLNQLALERGLLIRAQLTDINNARVLPSLGNQNASPLKSNYLAWMNLLHDETISEAENNPGQWLRNKTFGSQYWPDTGGNDPFAIDVNRPNDSFSGMNYWDPAGNEVLEFLRSGEPKWAWDIALPLYKTMTHSAYLNIGFYNHGNRAGVAVQAGGPGCEQIVVGGNTITSNCTNDGSAGGQWHRSAFGSDDYTYNMSLDLAYAIRPNAFLRDRFMMAGAMLVNRYDTSISENQREDFVNVINNTRQVLQHLEMLANCAEFVAGTIGQDCDNVLKQVVSELARDNLKPALMCQGFINQLPVMSNSDIPAGSIPVDCLTPQQFMVNALMYPFYHRYLLNYGDPTTGSITNMLVNMPLAHAQFGIGTLNDGSFDANSDWWTRLYCQLNAAGDQISSCSSEVDSDGNTNMWPHNKPHTAALMLMAHELDPSINLCNRVKLLFSDNTFTGAPFSNGLWDGVGHFNQAGWWKGVAQMLQSMIFAVGIHDTC